VTRAAARRLQSFLVAVAAICCAAVVTGTVSGASATSASASTYYVSTSGSNQNPGTFAEPWRTPQHAVNQMAPGDTTFVLAGTYSGQTYCDAGSGDGGSAEGGYVSLKAYPGGRPVLRGALSAILKMNCDYFIVQGFDIAGPAIVNGTNVYPVSGSDHVRLIGNDIYGSICQGVSMDPDTADYEFLGNRIHHNGVQSTACDEQAHGLYLQGDRHVVKNNLIYDNHDYGIQVYPYARDSDLAYNTVTTNGRAGLVIGGSGRGPSGTGVAGITMVGNIFAFNTTFGIHRAQTPPDSCDIHGNVFHANPAGDVENGFPSGCVGANTSANPLFLKLETRDLHLLTGSPAIDIGDPVYQPPNDFDGVLRPQGAGPDVGAYEFSSTPRPPPSPPPHDTRPTVDSRPFLRGVTRRGSRLATSSGKWAGTRPISVRFRWRRCNKQGRRCTGLPRAKRATCRLISADVGSRLYAVVTAANAFGSATARTRLSAVVKR